MNPYYPKRFLTLDSVLKKEFGEKVVKIPLNAGLGCPNRDGRCGFGGCSFCSGKLSGECAGSKELSLAQQFEETKKLYMNKWGETKYIAYLQSGTNTYAPVDYLRRIYYSALSIENVVGLSIATRADCLDDDVLKLLEEINSKTYLSVELGLQSSNDKTAGLINRGYGYEKFLSGYNMLRQAGVKTCIHIINGLIGEDKEDMLKTALDVARLEPYEVKIHLMYVVAGTLDEKRYLNKELKALELDEYIDIVCDQLERLSPFTAVGRLTGDGDRKTLVAPLWSRNKRAVLNGIDKELAKRNSIQGMLWGK